MTSANFTTAEPWMYGSEYDLNEQTIFELLERVTTARVRAEQLRAENYREMFGWAPGDVPETLPEPPEPRFTLDPDIGDDPETLPLIETYFDPDTYMDLELVHPDLRDQGKWSNLLGWDMFDLDDDLGLENVPDIYIAAELDEAIYEWLTDKMSGKDRIRPDGTWSKQSHTYIGIYNHWLSDGTIDRLVSDVIQQDTNTRQNVGASVEYLRNRLDALLSDNDGSLDVYFLEYQMDRAMMIDE